MAWTPPTKAMVFITFLLWVFGLFIMLDQSTLLWAPSILPAFSFFGFSSPQTWMLIALIVIFLSWFLFFLAIIVKGL
ncbi:MAG: hypothetical protein ACFE8E_04255 [Candidatus Hodarchaeota archaeon]